MSTQPNHALNWHELHDDNDSPCWEAASIYHDDGSPFYFRIGMFGKLYAEDSDSELRKGPRRTWPTLEAAKGDLQRDHERMIHAETQDTTRAHVSPPLHARPEFFGVKHIKRSWPEWDESTQTLRIGAPELSEYIHPAHCEPEEDAPPQSLWREPAVYLAAAAIVVVIAMMTLSLYVLDNAYGVLP